MHLDSRMSWKAFPSFCWLWNVAKKKVDNVSKEVVVSLWEIRWFWWMRQQVHRQICSYFGKLVVWHAVCHCYRKLNPFCWPKLVETLPFGVCLINLLNIFLRWITFQRFGSVVDWLAADHWWALPSFRPSLALRSPLELLPGPSSLMVNTSCHTEFTFQSFWKLHLGMVCCYIREMSV